MTTMTKNRAVPVSIGQILQTMTGRDTGHATAAADTMVIQPVEIPRLSRLDTGHDPKVGAAIAMARAWQGRREADLAQPPAMGEKKGSFASLVLVAAQATREQAVAALGKAASETAVNDWLINRTGYGCGKTYVAKCCLWVDYLCCDGVPIGPSGKMIQAAEIIPALNADIPPGLWFGASKVICIDDVGAEGNIEYVSTARQEVERQSRYTRIVDHCYREKVSLIITGNLTIHGLAAWVGGRAWSRLLEMAPAGAMLDMTGVPDYRRKVGGR